MHVITTFSIKDDIAVVEFPAAAWKIARVKGFLAGRSAGIVWPGSCSLIYRRSMSRLSVLSIVLALAIGPDAAAICGLWCTGVAAAPESCDHGASDSPLIAAGHCCDPGQAGAVLPTALRSEASSPYAVHAVSQVRGLVVDSGRPARPDRVPGSRCFIDGRPQTTVLRI